MTSDLRFRTYDPRDRRAVLALDGRALRAAGTDPGDVPGSEDLRRIEAAYLDAGGAFLVGVDPGAEGDEPGVVRGEGADGNPPGSGSDGTATAAPATFDGALVAMGGVVPTGAGRAEERDVAGAAELHRMRVAPARQGEGHGTALLRELEDRARELGFDRLLATTAARQRAAVHFYPARGYRETGRSTHGGYELIHFETDL